MGRFRELRTLTGEIDALGEQLESRKIIDRAKGVLIDEAGLKGHSIGGAMVSDQHANFIVAQPGASASDIRRLIDDVRTLVFQRHGIELESEVVVWQRGDRP